MQTVERFHCRTWYIHGFDASLIIDKREILHTDSQVVSLQGGSGTCMHGFDKSAN